MLTGLQKAKALKELKQLRLNKASQSGLALAKSLKRMRALRLDLGMGKNTQQPTSDDGNPLQAILTGLQAGTLTPADLDVAEIDRLIAEKTPENEAILGQIMDIVADSYKAVA